MGNKIVEVQGLGNVEFPDSMPDDAIAAVIRGNLGAKSNAPMNAAQMANTALRPKLMNGEGMQTSGTGTAYHTASELASIVPDVAKNVGGGILGAFRSGFTGIPGTQLGVDLGLQAAQGESGSDMAAGALGINKPALEQAAQNRDIPALIRQTVSPVVSAVAGAELGRRATPTTVDTTPINERLIAALKPTGKNAPKVQTAINTVTPDLQRIATTDNPSNLGDLHGSLQKVSLAYESKFQNLLKPNENVSVSTDPIADRIQSVIDKRPEQASALQPLVDKYRGKSMTLGELNMRRPDVSGPESTGIRDVLYGELDRLNPDANVMGLKQAQSALLTIQGAAKQRIGNLLTPDALIKSQSPVRQFINTAEGLHVTRPATLVTKGPELLKIAFTGSRTVPSEIAARNVIGAMNALRGTKSPFPMMAGATIPASQSGEDNR